RRLSSAAIENFLKLSPSNNLQLFKIRNNQLAFPRQPSHPRAQSLAQTLKALLLQVPLPDADFIISLEDAYFLDPCQKTLAPVFTFAKDLSLPNLAILMPDFEALEGNFGFRTEVLKARFKYPWKQKANRAFWRGATSGGTFSQETYLTIPRARLVFLSQKEPDLVDAKFTCLCQGAEQMADLFQSQTAPAVCVAEHLKYKYQILIDGNSCAYSRAYWQLFSDSVILKQESSHIQWFYSLLKPSVHYIPFKNDCSDLIEKLKWAKTHDGEVKKIALKARKIAEKNLKKADTYLYLYLLLWEYSKLFETN
ncbi:MAG: glycosyl transferase family 90, partial [Parachlamydiales bacterium]